MIEELCKILLSPGLFQGEGEAKLEQNARHWIDALLDRVDLKHLKDEENLQLKRRIHEILTKRI